MIGHKWQSFSLQAPPPHTHTNNNTQTDFATTRPTGEIKVCDTSHQHRTPEK